MRSVVLFAEDFGHEAFVTSLVERIAREYQVDAGILPYTARGGHGKVIAELARYLRDRERGSGPWPDLLVVATDANCKAYRERKQEVDAAISGRSQRTICAIPDPHVERWLLLDSSAFKKALGKGCRAPDHKCERDRYKRLLIDAIREAGVTPLLGGIEHTRDIVNAMDLDRMESTDDSLGKLIQDLRQTFRLWSEV